MPGELPERCMIAMSWLENCFALVVSCGADLILTT
jgi:hypothetical protein